MKMFGRSTLIAANIGVRQLPVADGAACRMSQGLGRWQRWPLSGRVWDEPQGTEGWPARGDQKRFPYEPRIIGGRLLLPAELQRIHRAVLDDSVVETISDEMRIVVESAWPELVYKLPPKKIA
jgi:hypothetical protein